jgi:hypothetical protein
MASANRVESCTVAMKAAVFGVLWFLFAALAARADELPARIFPEPPFPRILQEAPTIESIAPGVEYGDYQLITQVGPLSIHVVAIAPHRQDIRMNTVLANNALESRGETIGSMAQRTGAIAGLNGDYFDIGNTNRPDNIVVRGGVLEQFPTKRYALAISRDDVPTIAQFGFLGQIVIGDRTVSLDGIDEISANGGASLITPQYGTVPPRDNVTLIALEPMQGTPPLASYRVTRIADNLRAQPPGYYVAVGTAAFGAIQIPNPGDVITASGELSPVALNDIQTAIGGGPLILHEGTWYDDPNGPRGGEYAKRIPCSGAAIAPDGWLFLIEVDGREPTISVGLMRHEFASLMRALGATEGMAFDGGGSSTIAVRRLGDGLATMQNAPSDGKERPVANGIFVYSTAPVGPAVALVAQPGMIRAVSGANVALRVGAIDAAKHPASMSSPVVASVMPASLGVVRNGRFVAMQPGMGRIVLHSGSLSGDASVEVTRTPARIAITPFQPNVDRNGAILLNARAYDDRGYALALPGSLGWKASAGKIDARGLYLAGQHDANVSVRIGDGNATTRVTVGTHEIDLSFAQTAHFVTVPRGGPGSVARDPSCPACVQLAFSFGGNERAAYAMSDIPLPAGTLGLSFDVLDDGSAGRVRIAVRNSINETTLLDATMLGQPGWRHVVIRFPQETQAVRLIAIYVLPLKGMELSAGQITLRNVRAVVAGE